MAFLNILPDPNFSINRSGQATGTGAGHVAGPGYKSVKLDSVEPLISSFTNSGRYIGRSISSQHFKVNISYNPMTRESFEPVYNFLLSKRNGLIPFFISLPQYRNPQDSKFVTYLGTSPSITVAGAGETKAGSSTVVIQFPSGWSYASNGSSKPGDLVTFNDSNNSNHLKTYHIVRAEYASGNNYEGTAPGALQQRLTIVPTLQRTITAGTSATPVFLNPLLKVITDGRSGVNSYSLNVNNLYSFSLRLREVQ